MAEETQESVVKPVRVFMGRKRIYSAIDLNNFDTPTLLKTLSDAFSKHSQCNLYDMKYLVDYYLGRHPEIMNKTKDVRESINNRIIVNLQKAIVRDTTGYFMGTPVQYVARDNSALEAVKRLSDCMELENMQTVDKEVEDFCSIVGLGYKGIFFDSEPVNEVPFQLVSLSPLTTFSIYGTTIGSEILMIVSYNTYYDLNDNIRYNMVVYTNNFELVLDTQNPSGLQETDIVSMKPNPYGMIPIVEYQNNMWNKGDIEDVLSIIDALDRLDSNNMDDVEQVIQSILLLFGISQKQQEEIQSVQPKDLLMFDGDQGINQDGKYISPQLDVNAITTFREHLEETMRVIAGVPDRKTRGGGGGDTGDAVKLRDGWADMELVARDKEKYWRKAEMQLIRVALRIMEIAGQPLGVLPIVFDVKFTRNKTDNLQSKAQAGATLNSMGIAKQDVLSFMEITNDIAEVVKRWEENEQQKQERQQELFQQQNQQNSQNDNKQD